MYTIYMPVKVTMRTSNAGIGGIQVDAEASTDVGYSCRAELGGIG